MKAYEPSGPYGPEYFSRNIGGGPYDRTIPKWLEGSRIIAKEIVGRLRPASVLDVGCAKGFLVESLWDAGIEAYGMDVSDYAISQVRPDIRPFCWAGSITDPLPRQYGLITCIETVEHLSDDEIKKAINNLTAASPLILFSSTPFSFDDPTHRNVRPVMYWLNLFKEFAFYPDVGFDASFVMPHAILFRKLAQPLPIELLQVFAGLLTQKALLLENESRRRALDWKGEHLDEAIESGGGNAGPILPGGRVQFTLVAQEDRLCRVDFFFFTYVRVNTSRLLMRIKRSTDGTELRSSEISARGLTNNAWHPWRFRPIADSGGKSFVVELSSPDASADNAVTVGIDEKQRIAFRAYSLQPSPEEGWLADLSSQAAELEDQVSKLQKDLASAHGELASTLQRLEASSQEVRRLMNRLDRELEMKEAELQRTLQVLAAQEGSAAWQFILRFRTWKETQMPVGSRRRKIYDAAMARIRGRLHGRRSTLRPAAALGPKSEPVPHMQAALPIPSERAYQPKVSVVSAVYNKADSLAIFIEAFTGQTYGGMIEVVLVDDGSTDDSVALICREITKHADPGARRNSSAPTVEIRLLRNNTSRGNCAARNVGIAAAAGEIVIVIDADCIVNRDFVRAHVAAHADPLYQVVIGPFNLEAHDRPVLDVLKGYEAEPSRVLSDMQLQNPENETHFLNCITRNFSIKRERIEEPLFDEQFGYTTSPESGFGWEDIEMGYRLYRRGMHVRFATGAFSIHMSHPPAVPEREKPVKSLRNFRRLYEKHPELANVAPRWTLETYARIRDWMKACNLSDNDDVAALNRLLGTRPPSSPALRTKPIRLRILTYRWHCGHQYELYKLPFDFTLARGLNGFTNDWDYDSRPLRPNARLTPLAALDLRDFDLAILHFDEFGVAPNRSGGKLSSDWGDPFKYLMAEFAGPKVAICHGTPMFHGAYTMNAALSQNLQVIEEERQRLVEFVKNTLVICNSHQAEKEWGFHRSKTIWHGFDPAEYPPAAYQRKVITVAGNMLQRPHYRGYFLYQEVLGRLSCECHYLGDELPNRVRVWPTDRGLYSNSNDYASAKFLNYVTFLRMYSIFFNPTLRSPMPRTRGEAMLCGLAVVTTNNHDVDQFIRNGENGFYSNDPRELADIISRLAQDEALTHRIGQEGRRTAMDVFHLDRYHADWLSTVGDLLGSSATAAPKPAVTESPKPAGAEPRPSVLYVSACSGADRWCYRCDEIAEQLQHAGFPFYKLTANDPTVLFSVPHLLERHNLVLFHRVPVDQSLNDVLRAIRDRGGLAVLDYEETTQTLDSRARADLGLFDFLLCRVRVQERMIRGWGLECFTLPVSYTQELWNLSQISYQRRRPNKDGVLMGFVARDEVTLEDFSRIAEPVLSVLDRYPGARLLVIGPEEFARRSKSLASRVEFRSVTNWRKLPLLRADVDINLVPPASSIQDRSWAEREFLQASLLQMPTVLSPPDAEELGLKVGETAYVAAAREQWQEVLESAITNVESRLKVGRQAFGDVQRRYSPVARAQRLKEVLLEMVLRKSNQERPSR